MALKNFLNMFDECFRVKFGVCILKTVIFLIRNTGRRGEGDRGIGENP